MTASANASITVLSNAATSVTITILGPFTAPLAAGTPVANIIVAPENWAGALSLSGADAARFVISPGSQGYAGYLGVGSVALPAGSFSVAVTATP